MKNTKPVVNILIFGLALLAGGQFWILTESLLLGGGVGMLVLVFLAWFVRGWGKPPDRKKKRIGEIQEIDEEDFVHLVNPGKIAKKRLQEKVEKKPDQVADSIRSLLVKDKPSRKN